MRMWCGIDWAQRHHDIAVVDDDGVLVLKRRIDDSAVGFRQLLELLAEQTQRSEVSMQPEGWGSSLARTTADGSAPGTEGAAMTRPACTPGTAMSEMATSEPSTGSAG